ncbi:hypothetical protein [Natronohydrobacter thiooxidans]|uniref:hypothetical protein n=1 Tax=Natronohydrobacter thiooxidans TaxID=87172 RepID=UPI000B21CEA8|nr:hypothetical protein [Natronohydrobacter thiooxidans]
MEVVLIEGYANAGKSTLVRCLSGIGNAQHIHANCRNVLQLDWINPKKKQNTLVLASSLNEGITQADAEEYTPVSTESLGAAIPPWQVEDLLDSYQATCQAEKAILCISATALIRNKNWNAQAYADHITNNNGGFGKHPVTHVVSLTSNPVPLPLFNAANNLMIPAAQFPARPNITRNALAFQVRPFINLV